MVGRVEDQLTNNCVIQAPSQITGLGEGCCSCSLSSSLLLPSCLSATRLGRQGAKEQPEVHLSALKEQ